MAAPSTKTGRHHSPRTCGFRLSAIDVGVLVVAAALTIGTWSATHGLSLLMPFVVGHFFLFCNVFHVRRTPELVWSGLFLLNCICGLLLMNLRLPVVLALQMAVTLLILWNEIRQPVYHGVFSRQLNPHLQDYLNGQSSPRNEATAAVGSQAPRAGEADVANNP